MNYTEEVKQELYKLIENETRAKKFSFLVGVTKSLAQINAFAKDASVLTYEIKDEKLANLVSALLIELFDIEHEIECVDIEPKLYVISLYGDKANDMLKEMGLSHFDSGNFVNDVHSKHLENISNMEKAQGYLQGVFVSLGAVYFPKEENDDIKRDRGYHIEITFLEKEHARRVQLMLEECKIPLTYIDRESTYALYSKSSEHVSDALAFLGASKAVLKLNAVSIQRYMNNEINRMSNIEAANMDKTAIANAKYIEAIETIDSRIGIAHIQDEKLRLVCEARLEDKTSSLSILSEKLNMSKSSVNRMLSKAMKLAATLEEK